jgi:hypothetical protein
MIVFFGQKGERFFMRMQAGKYRHYKGNDYEAFCLARDINGGELYVLYRKLYCDCSFWIRPRDMFFEDVEDDGAFTARFALVGEPEDCVKKIGELQTIAEENGGALKMRHSETMAVYTIAGYDSGRADTVLVERFGE